LLPDDDPEIVASSINVSVLLTVPPEIVKPVAWDVGIKPLILVAVATPNTGVVNVGLSANTAEPLPVSFDKVVASCAEVTLPAAVPYNVPVVGKVTVVAPVVFKVKAFAPVVLNAPAVVNAPAVLTLPPRLIVFAPLLIPVPP
jgi:hypothetical protein